jgi:excisionase family DNA binding protein
MSATAKREPSPLMTAEEVAELLRVTPEAIYAMKARGELPGVVKLGRRLRFRREELYEWVRRAPSS